MTKLEVITGPMYAGKTSELIRRVDRAKIAGKSVIPFKPSLDDRYDNDRIGSHDGKSLKAHVVEDSSELREKVNPQEHDVVVVDEVNFFDRRLTSNLQSLAYRGHRVIAAGTDQTFRGTPFTPVGSLMAVADQVDKLQAVCQECGKPASMNQRLNENGEPAHVDEPTVKVGGEDIYEARCRQCHEVKTQ